MRLLIRCLLLVALILQSLIPIGFMPDIAAAKDGVFRLVICTGYEPLAATTEVNTSVNFTQDAAQQANHHQHNSNAELPDYQFDAPCTFSIDTVAALVPFSPAGQTGVINWRQAVFEAPQVPLATTTQRKTAPPRAPPAYS